MCLGAALLSGLLSAAGSAITASEQQRNAQAQADARNKVLKETLLKNDAIAKDARDLFDKRTEQTTEANVAQQQQKATDDRTSTIESAISSPDTSGIPISGSAPSVVKSSLAKAMLDTFNKGKERAQSLGKLGGYGDTWFGQGLQSADTARNLSMDSNFTSGNLAILPYTQDLAEQAAYKPISPIGGILSGLGGMFSGGGRFG